MLVYIYQADLYCEECGEKIREDLAAKGEAPEFPEDEYSYDSDDFPKGPTEEGETDSPSHCAGCSVFLESVLTDEGKAYVVHTVRRNREEGWLFTPPRDHPVSEQYGGPGQFSCPSEEWASFYDDLDYGDVEDDGEDEDGVEDVEDDGDDEEGVERTTE